MAGLWHRPDRMDIDMQGERSVYVSADGMNWEQWLVKGIFASDSMEREAVPLARVGWYRHSGGGGKFNRPDIADTYPRVP